MQTLKDFLSGIPRDYDTYNISARFAYFTQNLAGFDNLSNSTQHRVTSLFQSSDVNAFTEIIDYVNNNGWNVTLSWIFDEFMNGFSTTTTTTTTTPSAVDEYCTDDSVQTFTYFIILIIPAVLICSNIAFLKRRKTLAPNCCGRRPGIAYPVNFIDEASHRLAYAAGFALMSYMVLNLFDGNRFLDIDVGEDFTWTKTFMTLVNVVLVGLIGYPFVTCVASRRNIIANIVGFLYTALCLLVESLKFAVCPVQAVEHVPVAFAYLELIYDIPVAICYIILLVTFVYDFILNIRRKCCKLTKEELEYEFSPFLTYTRNLLAFKGEEAPRTLVQKLKRLCQYKRMTGFHYSPRMICTMAVSFTVLYKMGIRLGIIIDSLIVLGISLLEESELLFREAGQLALRDLVIEYAVIGRYSFLVANSVSLVVHILFMVQIILSYRTNTKLLFKGDRSWHHEYTDSPASRTVACMRYSGYQIAYFCYGYIMMMVILLLVCFVFAILIVVPIMNKQTNFVLEKLIHLWPSVLVGLFIYYSQVLVAKFCFLQDNGKWLALTNRRIFHVTAFFAFFFNIVIGIFSCLKRIILSVVFGVILLCRLDRCLFMRGFEKFDSGFKSYLGMLSVEVTHNHPLVKTFVELSWRTLHENNLNDSQENEDQKDNPADKHIYENVTEEMGGKLEKAEGDYFEMTRPKKKLWPRNKWHLALTLINNPAIVADRWKVMMYEHREKKQSAGKSGIADMAVETIGNVGAASIALPVLALYDDSTLL